MGLVRKVLARVPFLKSRLRDSNSGGGTISREQLQQHLGTQTPTILEIGCNDGSHTLWFLKLFRNPRVYCFEPEPRAADRFRSNVGDRPNVKLFEIAISDHDGEIIFYQSDGQKPGKNRGRVLPEGWDLSGSIRKPKNHLTKHPWVKFDKSITVKTSTLDTWFKNSEIDTIDLIWMDVQGAEKDVFQGAKEALSKTRYLYTEYNNTELYEGQSTLEQLLEQLGHFELVTQFPNDVLLRNNLIEG